MNDDNDNAREPGPARRCDDRLVHALLLHLHDPRAASRREARVARVMAVLRRPPGAAAPAPRAPRPRGGRPAARAAAAAALIIVGVLLLTSTEEVALASLEDILGALGRPGDRTFRIRVEGGDPGAPGPGARQRPGLDAALLYLRDGDQFVLIRTGPGGEKALDGFDGRASWRIRAGVVVEQAEGPGAGKIPVPSLMAEMPVADLRQTLATLRSGYTVERLDMAPLEEGGAAFRHVFARKAAREAKGPGTIEIWADPATGMPRRVVFDQAKFQGSPQPRRLSFDLISERPLPQGWFRADYGAARAADPNS